MSTSERYNYAFDAGDSSSAWAARLLRQVPAGARVLELGPGPGAMTRVLVDRGHQVTVVENDPDALARLCGMGVEVIEGDLNITDWCDQLADRKFDAMLACDVLEHLIAPDTTLTALRRLAEPAARLIVSMPNIAYAGVLASLRLGQFDYAEKGLLDRTHMRFFTRSSLAKTLMTCGWGPDRWEGNRLPVERSEFVWHWHQLGEAQRAALIAGAEDFDVYQWMAVAAPTTDTVANRIKLADEEIASLKEDLHGLMQRHSVVHESLVEHQKAFSEAKTMIGQLNDELAAKGTQLARLKTEHQNLADESTRREQEFHSESEHLRAQVDGLRNQGWPGRVKRLLQALRE